MKYNNAEETAIEALDIGIAIGSIPNSESNVIAQIHSKAIRGWREPAIVLYQRCSIAISIDYDWTFGSIRRFTYGRITTPDHTWTKEEPWTNRVTAPKTTPDMAGVYLMLKQCCRFIDIAESCEYNLLHAIEQYGSTKLSKVTR